MTSQSAYRYRALRADGGVEVGTLAAAGRDAASAALAGRGLWPVSIEASHPVLPARPIPWADLALGLRLLANLLRAGLPLDRALASLADSAPQSWRPRLPRVRERVAQGQSLAGALDEKETGIPPLMVALVRAGEAAGGATGAVERAASVAESIAATRAAIRQALVYPAILLAAGLASLGFLTAVVLPRFAAILAELGQSPPATTRLVLRASEIAGAGALPLLFSAMVALVAWRVWISREEGRRRWHALLLQVPLIGRIRRSLAGARAAGAIGALLETGVSLPRALEHGAAAGGDEAIAHALRRARESIVSGESAPRALERERALTPTALRLARVGDETGRLGPMLAEAGRLEHADAERLVRAAVQLIEPAFILAFGGLVALVAAALLQALYGVRPA